MKKSIITLIMVCFLIFSASAFAQTFHTANQKTVAWDAVTTTTGGSSIDPAEMSYEVYLSRYHNPVQQPRLVRWSELLKLSPTICPKHFCC